MIKTLQFPLTLKSIVSTIANDFMVYDSSGEEIFFVEQKLLPIMCDIQIYKSKESKDLLYTIEPEGPILSFSASWAIYNLEDSLIGRLLHPSVETVWTGYYRIYNSRNEEAYDIYEDDPWIKSYNSYLKTIPILNFFTGYFFNPSYTLKDYNGNALFQLKKEATFLGNIFTIDTISQADETDDELCLLALFMLLLQENNDG